MRLFTVLYFVLCTCYMKIETSRDVKNMFCIIFLYILQIQINKKHINTYTEVAGLVISTDLDMASQATDVKSGNDGSKLHWCLWEIIGFSGLPSDQDISAKNYNPF